jgi:hypothetical protein
MEPPFTRPDTLAILARALANARAILALPGILVALTLCPLPELVQPGAEAFGKLGDALGPEEQQHDYQHDDQVGRRFQSREHKPSTSINALVRAALPAARDCTTPGSEIAHWIISYIRRFPSARSYGQFARAVPQSLLPFAIADEPASRLAQPCRSFRLATERAVLTPAPGAQYGATQCNPEKGNLP